MPSGITKIRVKTDGWTSLPNNGFVDLYDTYKVSLSENALSKLMTPAPNKDVEENESALQNGKRVTRKPSLVRKKDRNLTLELNVYGTSETDFLANYGRFCTEVLDKGFFDIMTVYQPNVVYRLTYIDCTQFEEFRLRLGKYALTVNEPDPTNRAVNSTSEWADYEPT